MGSDNTPSCSVSLDLLLRNPDKRVELIKSPDYESCLARDIFGSFDQRGLELPFETMCHGTEDKVFLFDAIRLFDTCASYPPGAKCLVTYTYAPAEGSKRNAYCDQVTRFNQWPLLSWKQLAIRHRTLETDMRFIGYDISIPAVENAFIWLRAPACTAEYAAKTQLARAHNEIEHAPKEQALASWKRAAKRAGHVARTLAPQNAEWQAQLLSDARQLKEAASTVRYFSIIERDFMIAMQRIKRNACVLPPDVQQRFVTQFREVAARMCQFQPRAQNLPAGLQNIYKRFLLPMAKEAEQK